MDDNGHRVRKMNYSSRGVVITRDQLHPSLTTVREGSHELSNRYLGELGQRSEVPGGGDVGGVKSGGNVGGMKSVGSVGSSSSVFRK